MMNTEARLGSMALLTLTLGCTAEVTMDQPAVGQGQSAITGGAPAGLGQLYATVALIDPSDEVAFCTGTLVAPTVVVTASHCIKHQDEQSGMFTTPLAPSEISVAFALYDADYPPASNVAAVASVHATSFDGSANADPGDNPEGLGHAEDIGVLMLARSITEQSFATILPMPEVDSRLAFGSPLTIAGYGRSAPDHTGTSGVLYIAETPYVRRNDYELLAGGAGHADACEGDSGGPAYQLAGGTTYLVGTASRGSANAMTLCGEGGIWTLVPAYESWIAEQSGGAYPPSPPAGDEDDDSDDDGDGCSVARARGRSASGWPLVALLLGLVGAGVQRRARL